MPRSGDDLEELLQDGRAPVGRQEPVILPPDGQNRAAESGKIVLGPEKVEPITLGPGIVVQKS